MDELARKIANEALQEIKGHSATCTALERARAERERLFIESLRSWMQVIQAAHKEGMDRIEGSLSLGLAEVKTALQQHSVEDDARFLAVSADASARSKNLYGFAWKATTGLITVLLTVIGYLIVHHGL